MNFNPVNELEESLIKYCKKNISEYPFYHILLRSNVFVLLHPNYPSESGQKIIKKPTEIHYHALEMGGNLYVPFFSSAGRMEKYLKCSTNQDMSSVEINVRSFLESINLTHSVLLNYKSDYGKEFTPPEIRTLSNLKFEEVHGETNLEKGNYSSMTLNERLFESGLMGQFDTAIKARNKSLAVEILEKVDLDQKAAEQTVKTIFENPEKYGYHDHS